MASDREGADKEQSGIARAVKISLVIFGVLLAVLAVAAFVSSEPGALQFEYEGFD